MPPTTTYMYTCWEVCQLLAGGWWFPLGTPVSPANKTDRHDMTSDVKVTLNPINPIQSNQQSRVQASYLKSVLN